MLKGGRRLESMGADATASQSRSHLRIPSRRATETLQNKDYECHLLRLASAGIEERMPGGGGESFSPHGQEPKSRARKRRPSSNNKHPGALLTMAASDTCPHRPPTPGPMVLYCDKDELIDQTVDAAVRHQQERERACSL